MTAATLLTVQTVIADPAVLRLGLVLFVVALAVVAIRGRGEFGRWWRLARTYPAAPRRAGARVWGDVVIFGRTGLRNSTWLEVDGEYLHVYSAVPLGPLRPPFSVPLGEISADAATWGVVRQPVVRLRFDRAAHEEILLRTRTFERLSAASGGRLRIVA